MRPAVRHASFARESEPVVYGARQLWRCTACRCERQWGIGRPSGPLSALLSCEGDCRLVTKHFFVRVMA